MAESLNILAQELSTYTKRFGLLGVLLLTASLACVVALAKEGLRYDSWLNGYGMVLSAILSVVLLLYLGTRFSSRPGAIRRIIYTVIVLVAIAAWLLLPGIQ